MTLGAFCCFSSFFSFASFSFASFFLFLILSFSSECRSRDFDGQVSKERHLPEQIFWWEREEMMYSWQVWHRSRVFLEARSSAGDDVEGLAAISRGIAEEPAAISRGVAEELAAISRGIAKDLSSIVMVGRAISLSFCLRTKSFLFWPTFKLGNKSFQSLIDRNNERKTFLS